MRRQLPHRPNLDHLKKQAKDLLDAFQRGEPEAIDRAQSSLPAFAERERGSVRRGPFALHDAQSTIAREYGFASWPELRAYVVELNGAPYSEANFRAVLAQYAQGWPLPPPTELFTAMRAAQTAERRAITAELLRSEVPELLPLLPVRNALLLRKSVAPFHIGRDVSLAALVAACRTSPGTLAVFAQRSEADESVTFERLHPIGCQAQIHARRPDAQGREFVVLEAFRTIVLHAIEQPDGAGGALYARVSAFALDEHDPTDELGKLNHDLRDVARRLVAHLPEPEPAIARLERIDDADLPDVVVASLPCSVAEKARFAAEPSLVERSRIALRLTHSLAPANTPARP